MQPFGSRFVIKRFYLLKLRHLVPNFYSATVNNGNEGHVDFCDNTFTMRFSSSLNSQSSHEALLLRQDTEVHLLELLKRSLAIRIKCDRDYSTSLQNFAAAFLKSENWQDVNESKVGLACRGFVMEAEALGRLMKDNADYLAANTFEKLNTVLTEKKAAKRYYQEEHNRISADLSMVQEGVRRSKTEYEKCLEAYRSVKHKAEDANSKGKSGRKGDELKDKLQKATRRLHNTHNEYVLALVAAADTDRDYRTVLLPGLLEYQQIAQEYLLLQWYNLLEDIGLHTQACLPEADHCHFRTQLADLRPDEEYVTFIEKHKCAPPPALELSFDYTLLQNSTGKLKANELVMDNFTAETIKLKLRDIQSKVLEPQNALSLKVVSLEEKERLIEDKSKSPLELSLLRKEAEFLRKEINELRCQEQKMERQVQLIHAALAAIPSDWEDMNEEAPIPRATPSSAPLNGGSVSKLGGQKIVSILRKPFFRISTSSSKMDNLDKASPSGSEANIANELGSDNTSTLPLTIDQSVAEPVSAINVALIRKEEATLDLRETEPDATPKFKLVFTAGKGLLEEEWFHGVLPREEVVRLLVHDGDFLVRETMRNEERQIVLSACWGGHKHFIVQTTAEALYRFEGPAFPTIQELIIHQYECGLPVTNKSGAILKTPIIRARWELNNDDVELVEKVGRGNFGDVYRARLRSTGQDVAVKTCRVTLPDEQKRKFLQEGRILKQYDHINIVKFIGICVQKQPIMIVMELVPGGSLLTFLRNSAASLSAVCLLRMCRDAAYGMAYLEANNCIHRDLAARNCLVGVDNMVKISDFGMSREEQEYIVSDGMKQIPIKWTAPEALNYGKYTALCDVWSYGILCWEVFSKGGTPYAGLTNTKAREMIDAGYRMPAPEGTLPKMYWLMRRCWEAEADRRPHFNEICVIMDEILQLMSSS